MCANRPIPPENMLAPAPVENHETHEAHESPAPEEGVRTTEHTEPAPNGYEVALDVLRVALRPDVSAEERRSLVLACRAYLRKKSHRRHWKANRAARAGEGARNA